MTSMYTSVTNHIIDRVKSAFKEALWDREFEDIGKDLYFTIALTDLPSITDVATDISFIEKWARNSSISYSFKHDAKRSSYSLRFAIKGRESNGLDRSIRVAIESLNRIPAVNPCLEEQLEAVSEVTSFDNGLDLIKEMLNDGKPDSELSGGDGSGQG